MQKPGGQAGGQVRGRDGLDEVVLTGLARRGQMRDGFREWRPKDGSRGTRPRGLEDFRLPHWVVMRKRNVA